MATDASSPSSLSLNLQQIQIKLDELLGAHPLKEDSFDEAASKLREQEKKLEEYEADVLSRQQIAKQHLGDEHEHRMLYFKKRELEYIDQQRKIIEDRKKELVGSINQQASNELKIVSQQRSDLTEHIKKLSEAKARFQKRFNPENSDMYTQRSQKIFLEECRDIFAEAARMLVEYQVPRQRFTVRINDTSWDLNVLIMTRSGSTLFPPNHQHAAGNKRHRRE